MPIVEILSLHKSYARLRSDLFVGNPALAVRAREAFLRVPCITSFEVSTQNGALLIGFDRRHFDDACRRELRPLLSTYLPGLDIDRMSGPAHLGRVLQ